jgi:hypothetical protein
MDASSDPGGDVGRTRLLGAPVVFACHRDTLQWWKQTADKPLFREGIESCRVARFFREHEDDFSPGTIFEGKTRRRLPGQAQLAFVDAGLMAFVERTDGEMLSRCVELAFGDMESALGREVHGAGDSQNAIKATFWLLAAKALCDKGVDNFKTVDLSNIDDVFDRVGRHYGVPGDVPPRGRGWHEATAMAAKRIEALQSLRNLSTEALAHVYENALVTPEVRKANGTHSTPGPLVDYIVWQLWPWIEALPPERRHVFEPACGHAGFLVSALRILRQCSGIDDKDRHDYLKSHLHGVERDEFAFEVGRLSLTLADIPHGNTWNLKRADMFIERTLENRGKECGVLLANPPFEAFTPKEKKGYERSGVNPRAKTKACEMLRRTIPHLTKGACFGVVVPRGLLHSKEGVELRRKILSEFEILEIDVFEDQLFEKADHEAAVLLGRRKTGKAAGEQVWSRRVRNPGMEAFRDRFAFSSEEQVEIGRFASSKTADLRVPDCDAVWRHLGGYPTLAEIAGAGQGFSFLGRDLPKNAWTLSDSQRAGSRPCFTTSRGDLPIFGTPAVKWMNPDRAVIQAARMGLDGERGQVLVNYVRVSRGEWSMRAWIDREGHAVNSNFLVVRPRQPEVPGLLIWALLNGPIANAFVYSVATKRHIIRSDLLRLPIPRRAGDWMGAIISASEAYIASAKGQGGILKTQPDPGMVKARLLAMDAAVLQAYDLPPRLERQVLDLFSGVQRRGVGCTFNGYYPPGLSAFLPLHLILSDRFQRAGADMTADRFKPGRSVYVREVLSAAVARRKGD